MDHISAQHEGFHIAVRSSQTAHGWNCEVRIFEACPETFDDAWALGRFNSQQFNAQNEFEAIDGAEREVRIWITNYPQAAQQLAVQTRQLKEQWDLACVSYAWHQVHCQVGNNVMRDYALRKCNEAIARFAEKGGVAKVGVGPLGDRGPALFLSNAQDVPYDSGRILVESLAAQMRTACT